MFEKSCTAPARETPDLSSVSTPSLANLCTFSEFAARTKTQRVFQSEAAVRWFYREHRAELCEAAEIEEGRVLGHPRGLRHVVGDDHDSVPLRARLEQAL